MLLFAARSTVAQRCMSLSHASWFRAAGTWLEPSFQLAAVQIDDDDNDLVIS